MEKQYAQIRGNYFVDGSGNFYFRADQIYCGPFGTLAKAEEFAATISTDIHAGYSLSFSGVGNEGRLDVYADDYDIGRLLIATLELHEMKALAEQLNQHLNKWEK